jgi:hypothetical protein
LTSPILVCPSHEELLSRLGGRTLVVKTNDPGTVPRILDFRRRYSFHLHCLFIDSCSTLDTIALNDDWQDTPLAVSVSGLGPFRSFMDLLPTLRKFNIRVLFPVGPKENYTSIRILSSLGIHTAVLIPQDTVDWELLSDLMTYAYFGIMPHAPIEPFDSLASHFDIQKQTAYKTMYFDDPSRYLHVDEHGRVALTSKDIAAGAFIAQKIEELDGCLQSSESRKSRERWRNHFLQSTGCSYCEGWRLCMGVFSDSVPHGHGCKHFVSELFDSLERYQSQQKRKKTVWQP